MYSSISTTVFPFSDLHLLPLVAHHMVLTAIHTDTNLVDDYHEWNVSERNDNDNKCCIFFIKNIKNYMVAIRICEPKMGMGKCYWCIVVIEQYFLW